MKHAGLIAAAGKSSRMGFSKALININGKTYIEHIVAALEKLKVTPIIVTLPECNEKKTIERKISRFNLIKIKNIWPQEEYYGSIKTAISLVEKSSRSIIIWPTDSPFASFSTVRKIKKKIKRDTEVPKIIIPIFKKKKGHPIGISNHFFSVFKKVGPINGLRYIVSKNSHNVKFVKSYNSGILKNINFKKDIFRKNRNEIMI